MGAVQVVAGASLLAPAIGLGVNALLMTSGEGASPAVEIGWLTAILGLAATGLAALLLVASRPTPIPPGDLTTAADRWSV